MAPGEQKISDESTKHSSDRLMSVIFREWPATTDALFMVYRNNLGSVYQYMVYFWHKLAWWWKWNEV